jgi:hypothetical protein
MVDDILGLHGTDVFVRAIEPAVLVRLNQPV